MESQPMSLKEAILIILATPPERDGQATLWTRQGVARHAELEDIPRLELDTMIDGMRRAGHVLEADTGGLRLVGLHLAHEPGWTACGEVRAQTIATADRNVFASARRWGMVCELCDMAYRIGEVARELKKAH